MLPECHGKCVYSCGVGQMFVLAGGCAVVPRWLCAAGPRVRARESHRLQSWWYSAVARWSLDGAEAVLKLRALEGNGDFDDYYDYPLRQQKQRDHGSRYQQPQPVAA